MIVFCSACLAATSVLKAEAQSHALNGTIEGTVADQNKAPVRGAQLTAENTGLGLTVKAASNEQGFFRFPILPPGPFRITAEAPGFRRMVKDGIRLSTGETTSVEIVLQIGDVSETVTVLGDTAAAESGRIEMGRVLNDREVRNLPLITLNPYTFAFLQSNVTGNRTAVPGIGVVNVHANGFSRRGSYLIDGNYATDMTMGGVRLLTLPRAFVEEVQLNTTGMSAEFGSTVGLMMNLVTPTGTNRHSGNLGYQMRRSGFAAQRFNAAPGAPKFDPTADVITAAFGGPLLTDRWHYYLGFEGFRWDLRSASRVITISEPNRVALIQAGVPESAMPPAYDAPETYSYYLLRSDLQINRVHRLGFRFIYSKGTSETIGVGATPGNTLQLTQDFNISYLAPSIQLISAKGSKWFNELRLQTVRRTTVPTANDHTGRGDVTIRIPQVASFGAPTDRLSEQEERFLTSLQNNFSIGFGNHSLKLGGGFAAQYRKAFSLRSAEFIFATIPHYLRAVTGDDRRSYSQYTDTVGDQSSITSAIFWNAFVQDEWRVTGKLRINVGLRYDLFVPPGADPASPYPATRDFSVDTNNFGPRLGLAYSFGPETRPAVIRASAGIYYDPPILSFYSRALRNNGGTSAFSFTLGPLDGPEFPNRFQSFPPGVPLPLANIEAMDPNFKTMSALHLNFQFEKALTNDLALSAAYTRSTGNHIPTARQVNCRPTGGTLADGRPLYGVRSINPIGVVTVTPCTDRILSAFRNILVWESVGILNYDALALKLTKRYSRGYQFGFHYTLARSVDDAAEDNISILAQRQSDPSNRDHDRALSLSDQRHTFVGTLVAAPRFRLSNRFLTYLLTNNQVALIARASDGERQNLRLNITDLNGDGVLMDRPVGIPRNFLKTPPYFMLDVRLSRMIRFSENRRLELFADISNLTNTNSVISFTDTRLSAENVFTSVVNPLTGELQQPLPDFRSRGVTSTDSRRMQVGIKLHL